MKYVRIFLILFGIVITTSSVTYLWAPKYMISLSREDELIQNLSAILYLLSAIAGFYFFCKSKINRKALLAVSVVSFIGFLDELSFGARILGIKMPLVYGVSIDAVHDFFYLASKIIYKLTSSYPEYMLPFLVVVIIVACIILIKYRFKLMEIIRNNCNKPSILLASFAVILILLALLIDLDKMENNFLFLLEELFEMFAAIALFFCSLSLRSHAKINIQLSSSWFDGRTGGKKI